MKLIKGYCLCPEGSHIVELAFLSPLLYGQFLLWSDDGECRYLDSIDNPVFDEVSRLISDLSGDPPRTRALADKVQMLFGEIACNRSSGGFAFSMRLLPVCDAHTKSRLAFMNLSDPPQLIDIEVESVDTSLWSELPMDGRHKAVEAALQESQLHGC